MKTENRILKDSNLQEYINIQRYKAQKPGILNRYYMANLLQIIDKLPEQNKKQAVQQMQRTNINEAVKIQTQKNELLNMSTSLQTTLTNIVMSYKHECDQLGSDTRINQYQITKTVLGKGSHSFVKTAKKQGKLYAIKTISYDHLKKRIIIKDQQITRMINSEISLLIKLRSPYIIGFEQAIYLPQKHRVFIVLEYCSKGTILKYINSSTTVPFAQWPFKVKSYMYQIALGALKMHQNNIIHRDIKAQNVLINEKDQIKIIDFNVSCEIPSNGMITITDKFIGTKTYASPQLLAANAKPREVDGKLIDVWALGITYVQLLQRKHPFANIDTPQKLIKKLQTPIQINKAFPPELRDLLQKMLKIQNKERIQVAEIVKHPWFRQ